MASLSPEEQLHVQFVGRPWFHSVGRDQYNRLVVYTNFMCHETLHDIPDRVDGIQVLTHFAGSKTATREQFTNDKRSKEVVPPVLDLANLVDLTDELEDDFDDLEDLTDEVDDLEELTLELDRLERICGSNILQDIFYEIHDGKNAVTRLSTRYPDVTVGLQRLYDRYGFDNIYEELDG